MADKTPNNLVLQWIALLGLVLLLVGSFTWMGATVTVDEDAIANKIASQMDITIPTVTAYVNLTGIEDRLGEIETNLNEEDDWEDEAIVLATEEWEDRDYKDIFKFLEDEYKDIDDKDDIVYVREDKKTTFTEMDADDEDAFVTQYVTVKYENSDGDNVKRDLTIYTEIEDSEIEDQKIELTP